MTRKAITIPVAAFMPILTTIYKGGRTSSLEDAIARTVEIYESLAEGINFSIRYGSFEEIMEKNPPQIVKKRAVFRTQAKLVDGGIVIQEFRDQEE